MADRFSPDRRRPAGGGPDRLRRALLLAPVAALVTAQPAHALSVLRAALLETGTVNWEAMVIRERGLDRAEGFTFAVVPFADNGATRVAFAGGAADVVVADWIWAAAQRAAGQDYVFLPYSTAVGGLVVSRDSPVRVLPDLKGRRIGIAGGPTDKSWLILRALAEQDHGFDLAKETEQVFGAPPLIAKALERGDVDAAINFWNFLARMEAAGARRLISAAEAARRLGLDPAMPLLGYVLKGEMLRRNPALVTGLARASAAAKALLASDDGIWQWLRPSMHAADDADFLALRDGYRAGIPPNRPIDRAAADRFLALMARLGGSELVGAATTVPDGLFVEPPR